MDRLVQLRLSSKLSCLRGSREEGNDGVYSTPASAKSEIASSASLRFASEVDVAAAKRLETFLKNVDSVHCTLREAEELLVELQQHNTEHLKSVDEPCTQRLRDAIAETTRAINEKFTNVKTALEAVGKEVAALKESPESVSSNSAIVRIYDNQHAYLLRKLVGVVMAYQKQQSANEAHYKAQVRRQIKIKFTNPDGSAVDDATVEQLTQQVMESNTTSYIFQQSKEVFASIIETRNDIYSIEQAMQNLNQLFNDVAFLVLEQGEMIDVVISNVQRSICYVESAGQELKQSKRYQKRSRKKIICMISCVSVFILLFVIACIIAGTI